MGPVIFLGPIYLNYQPDIILLNSNITEAAKQTKKLMGVDKIDVDAVKSKAGLQTVWFGLFGLLLSQPSKKYK